MPRKKRLPVVRDKYWLYEGSVQSPREDVVFIQTIYEQLSGGRPARALREDFSGTFKFSCEWVRASAKNTALAVDLDAEPHAYGKKTHLPLLTPDERQRIRLLRQDVRKTTKIGTDLIVACNFSFYVFKERQLLVDYFRSCYKSLRKGGVLLLEMAGGPGMIETSTERKRVRVRGFAPYEYVWDQKSFDPITANATYAIHFKLADGSMVRDAFTYDWRVWTLPEVTEALKAAGFEDAGVFWETTHKDKGTGEYIRLKHGDNAYAWIAYVVGVRKR